MGLEEKDLEALEESADQAAQLLKALSNRDRLLILSHLVEGERNVGDLERLVHLRQPTLSQQLARLRSDGLVATRRDGKAIYYRLNSEEVQRVLGLLYEMYCAPEAAAHGDGDVRRRPEVRLGHGG